MANFTFKSFISHRNTTSKYCLRCKHNFFFMQKVSKKFEYSLDSDCFSSHNRKEIKRVTKIIFPRILDKFLQYCPTSIFDIFQMSPLFCVALPVNFTCGVHLKYFQKQPPSGVLSTRCSENLQQIYRRTLQQLY